ncbi:MAG: hypothetical protein ABW185_08250 [Sedimenticola sp.]
MENKCSNCESEFKRRPNNKGYYRFSLDNTLPQSDSIAKDALGNLTGSQFTPVSSKRKGKFMCPSCWSKLADTVQYRRKVEDFWSCTEHGSYIGQKRKGTNEQSGTSKVPRFTTSTPASSREHTQPGDTSFEHLVITPVKVTGTVRKTLFKPSKTAKWDTIVKAVRTRQYGRAISGLFHATKGSQKQFLKFLKRTIRKEVSSLIHEEIALGMETTIPNIGSFSWNDVIAQLKIQSPVLETVLRSAITTPSTEETLKRAKSINLKPHLGIAAATLLHARAPRKVNFLQTLLSIQFWRGGLKRETIKQLAHTGICMSYAHTLNAVDKIREGFDKAATASKEGVEQSLGMAKEALIHQTSELELSVAMANTVPNIEDEVNGPSDAEDNLEDDANDVSDGEDAHTDDDADADEVVSDESDEECKDGNELEDTPPIESTITNEPVADEVHGGFTLCWDNVGKKVISRNPSETRTNAYMNMALGYMAINRVPTTGLNSAATDVKQACDMDADCFLPHVGDFCELRNRMSTIIERYICRHLEWFKTHFSEVPEAHILHEHSYQSSKKSVILNLGVFDENPCSTQGAIGIYQRLQKYVPSANDEPITILVYGDGLSCERGNDAHRARSNGLSAWERLDGLEPAAQEFHKEMILLQDYFDEFFSASSSSDRGTLVQLKNLFNFRTVKADISDNFTHAWELMCLTTEGLVCLHVMEILGIETPLSRPTNAPPIIERGSVDEKKAYISEVSKTVVDALWHETDTSKLHEVPPTPPTYTYCVCHVDLGDDVPMIGCENGESCYGDEWYHYRCIGMKQEDVPTDDCM